MLFLFPECQFGYANAHVTRQRAVAYLMKNRIVTVSAEMDAEACAMSVNEARNKGAFIMGSE